MTRYYRATPDGYVEGCDEEALMRNIQPRTATGRELDNLCAGIGIYRQCVEGAGEVFRWFHLLSWLNPKPHEHNEDCETDEGLRKRTRDFVRAWRDA